MIAHDGQGSDRGSEALTRLLDDPDHMASLEQFVDRLPQLNAALGLVEQFVASSSRFAENAHGMLQTARQSMGDPKVAVEAIESLKRTASTTGRIMGELEQPLADPQTAESLRKLVEMLPKLVATMEIVEQFLASSSRFAENMNSIVTTARKAAEKSWPDLLDRQGLLSLPQEVLKVVQSHSLRQLLESQVLSDGALEVMDQVAGATVEAHQKVIAGDERIGRIGAFKALGDPDVQRGLALTIELARQLGKRLHSEARAAGGPARA